MTPTTDKIEISPWHISQEDPVIGSNHVLTRGTNRTSGETQELEEACRGDRSRTIICTRRPANSMDREWEECTSLPRYEIQVKERAFIAGMRRPDLIE